MKTITLLLLTATLALAQEATVEPLALTVSKLPYQLDNGVEGMNPLSVTDALPKGLAWRSGTELLLKVTLPSGYYPAHCSSAGDATGGAVLTELSDSKGVDIRIPAEFRPSQKYRPFADDIFVQAYADPTSALVLVKALKTPSAGSTGVSGKLTLKAIKGDLRTVEVPMNSRVFGKGSPHELQFELSPTRAVVSGGARAWICLRGYDRNGKIVWQFANTNSTTAATFASNASIAKYELVFAEGDLVDFRVPFNVNLDLSNR